MICPAVITVAAPRPASSRYASSCGRLSAVAISAEAIEVIAVPSTSTCRRPRRSESMPAGTFAMKRAKP
ncbi:MAG: hypothetical protein WCI61_10390 [Chloroflexota bacterium]